jgi:NAD(P)-dependent dehydrogenase (short-subunit alcohol dehydrogenase family)
VAVQADVSAAGDCRRLIGEALRATGRIDVLVNNAGIAMRAPFGETEFDVLKKVMDTNFWGAVYCTRFALPALLEARGSVVGVSSIAGKQGLPGRTGYSASKFALEGFLQSLRIEYLRRGLHVLVACPGFTASNIRVHALTAGGAPQGETPREEGRMMQPDEVARRIVRAVRRRRRDLVLTAEGRAAVWLNRFFPGWTDRLVFNKMAKEKDAPFG